jgi:hypothetical protein
MSMPKNPGPNNPGHKSPGQNGHTPDGHRNEESEKINTALGYEPSDVRVRGILVFLFAMGIFVAVTGVACYWIGKAFNARMNKEDGPNNKWTQTVDIRALGDMPSSPELQNKMLQITQSFPTPRVQLDDGNQDVADLHAREDILLDNYTWVDQSKGTVRIPIERAMEIIAQKGLPVAAPVQTQAPMVGDAQPVVTMPLTDGFARTAYEQDQESTQAATAVRSEPEHAPAH